MNIWGVRQQYERLTKKIKKGDVVLLFIFRVSPLGFHGAFEVVSDWTISDEIIWSDEISQGHIIYPFRIELRRIALGFARYDLVASHLGFVQKKTKPAVWAYLKGTPANFGRPISELDFKTVLDELRRNPPVKAVPRTLRRPKDLRSTELEKLTSAEPNHEKIRAMLREIGGMENRIAEIEYRMNGRKLDVVWKRVAAGVPSHVFEIQIGGSFLEAIEKLKHAYDLWNSKPILVTVEKYEAEAKNLLQGSFHEIHKVATVVNWKKISRLYRLLKEADETRREVEF